jgi:ubiquinone biosynthesis protein
LPLIEELAQTVPEELNFANEGRNAETISKFFSGRADVCVPSIHWDLTSERLLVSDFVERLKISDVDGIRAAGLDCDRIVALLVETYCEQIFRQGFFHADPHPGNLLVRRMEDGQPRLVYLDFSLARRLPDGFRKGALDFVAAMLQSDADAMSRALLDLGFQVRDGSYQGLEDIADAVLRVAQQVQSQGHIDRAMRTRLREELPRRIRENPLVAAPSHLVLVARVVTMLSGLAHTLDSHLDLATTILPYVELPTEL